VTQTVVANEIGANLIRGRDFGNNQVFGALIALSGPNDFPDSVRPLNTPDVLRIGLLTAPNSFNDEVSTSITPVTLNPGHYALLFGANQFGATGEAQASPNTSLIGTPSFFFWNPNISATYINETGGSAWGMFVNGVIPEPATLGLVSVGFLSLGQRRRHRRAAG
jgi:hypothetical protein